jgi:hypothetical protein
MSKRRKCFMDNIYSNICLQKCLKQVKFTPSQPPYWIFQPYGATTWEVDLFEYRRWHPEVGI